MPSALCPPLPPAALRSEINLDELSGGAKINRIFFERFPYELNKVYYTYRVSGVAIEYRTVQYSNILGRLGRMVVVP
jgi:hypothetical protein